MMIDVLRVPFLNRLEIAARITPTRTPTELLKYCRIEHSGGVLKIAATDHVVGVLLTLANIDGIESVVRGDDCEFLIPAVQLVQVLRTWKSDRIKFSIQKNGILAKGNREEFRFKTTGESFPWWTCESTRSVQVNGDQFRYALANASFAAAAVCARNTAFEGAMIRIGHGKLWVVSTDGNVMAVENLACDGDDFSGSLPMPAVEAIRQVTSGHLTLEISTNSVIIRDSQTEVFARLLHGNIPKFEIVLSGADQQDVEFQIAGEELISLTRQMLFASDREYMRVEFEITGGANSRLLAKSSSDERGAAFYEVPIVCPNPLKWVLGVDQLRRMTAVLDSESVLTWGASAERANSFKSERESWRTIIMPLAIL